MQFNSYLFFDGNCQEAFEFYQKLFGGKIELMLPHEGSPAASQVPPEWQKKILHARMSIGNAVLLASDAPPGRFHRPQGFSVNVTVNDVARAEQIFGALAENATAVTMPIAETFWARRFGMLTDRFGIPWMINCQTLAENAA
jgi:PhnB protein